MVSILCMGSVEYLIEYIQCVKVYLNIPLLPNPSKCLQSFSTSFLMISGSGDPCYFQSVQTFLYMIICFFVFFFLWSRFCRTVSLHVGWNFYLWGNMAKMRIQTFLPITSWNYLYLKNYNTMSYTVIQNPLQIIGVSFCNESGVILYNGEDSPAWKLVLTVRAAILESASKGTLRTDCCVVNYA